jgi:hypothetical protein
VEATIDDIQKGFKDGTLTAHQVTQMYLDRIDAYDKHGPIINSVITINPKALEDADKLDAEFKKDGQIRWFAARHSCAGEGSGGCGRAAHHARFSGHERLRASARCGRGRKSANTGRHYSGQDDAGRDGRGRYVRFIVLG